jgi:hypothetical protein
MIKIIVVMIVCIIVMIKAILNIKRDNKRIKELEDILNRYYEEREKTLKLRLKDKGLIK